MCVCFGSQAEPIMGPRFVFAFGFVEFGLGLVCVFAFGFQAEPMMCLQFVFAFDLVGFGFGVCLLGFQVEPIMGLRFVFAFGLVGLRLGLVCVCVCLLWVLIWTYNGSPVCVCFWLGQRRPGRQRRQRRPERQTGKRRQQETGKHVIYHAFAH